eukprot:Hpha_TRINITY_DN15786_c0_g1::TRINITY_DN15786_c0_g1_i3::g.37386::m.37386
MQVLRKSMVRVSFHIAKVIFVDLFLSLMEYGILAGSPSTELIVIIALGMIAHVAEGVAAGRSAVEMVDVLREINEFQLKRETSSIDVAADIAGALAVYDVDAAEEALLKGMPDLPVEMAESYLQLLGNLRSYKPYLPQSCFVLEDILTPEEEEEMGVVVTEDGMILRTPTVDIESPITSPQIISPPQGPASPPQGPARTPGERLRSIHGLEHGERLRSIHGLEHGERLRSMRLRSMFGGPPLDTQLSAVISGHHSSETSRSSINAASMFFERPAALKPIARRARVSLAGSNMIGYITSTGDLAASANVAWITGDVEQWCTVVSQAKGLVDQIGGDRRYASFNAKQACGGHSASAVEVLSSSRGEGQWTGCVVSGQAVCGDFGSSSMMRFMVLG